MCVLRVMYDAVLYGLCFRAFAIVRVMLLLISVLVCLDCDFVCDDAWLVCCMFGFL